MTTALTIYDPSFAAAQRERARWAIPGDAVLAMAVAVNEGFEALAAATRLAGGPEPDAEKLLVTLRYLYSRLDTLHEIALAVAGEQPEAPRGNSRLH